MTSSPPPDTLVLGSNSSSVAESAASVAAQPDWSSAQRSAGNSAIISDCGFYRWRLERDLGRDGPTAALIGVNPSTADASINDQTIRKDIGFGAVHGWGRIIKGNKFGWRAKDIKALRTAVDPVGPENDAHLEQIMRDADLVVACWGPLAKLPKDLRRRWYKVVRIAEAAGKPLMCFGTAHDGQPLHTLTLAYSTPLVEWKRP